MSESVHEPGELATAAPLARVIDGIGRTRALDALGRAVRPLARRLSASPAGPLLRGDGVGHPLHPALTDLPIGFWTSAWCLDLIGGRGARRASQRLIALGVLSAVPTAAAGAVDWEQRPGRPDRRVGMAHAAANSAALVCTRRRGPPADGGVTPPASPSAWSGPRPRRSAASWAGTSPSAHGPTTARTPLAPRP